MDRWLKTGNLKNTCDDSDLPLTNDKQIEHVKDNGLIENSDNNLLASSDLIVPTSGPKCHSNKRGVKRKYDESYLGFGFTWTGSEDYPGALCVKCQKLLHNSSLVPAKMKRHLESHHPNLVGKDILFFKARLREVKDMQKVIHSTTVSTEKLLEVSYLISKRIATAGEAHTIAEDLIKPCMLEAAKILLNKSDHQKLESIPLSNSSVRIDDMGMYLKSEVYSRLQQVDFFCLQLDESTDVAGLAVLLAFVRYVYDGDIQEDLFLCKTLPTSTTGEEIFKILDTFMSENKIPWKKCLDVCTDGAKSMTGSIKGVVSRIKKENPECSNSHCALHRHQLATKGMPPELSNVLDDVIKIVNFVKSRPLKARIFSVICKEMGSIHCNLLLHTSVRWLNRGKVLAKVFELRNKLLIFFEENKFGLSCRLHEPKWLQYLSYMADIFGKLNDFNLSLQGKYTTVFSVKDNATAITRKLKFWCENVKIDDFACFSLLQNFFGDNNLTIDQSVKSDIVRHLQELQNSFLLYFPKGMFNCDWVRNPFSCSTARFTGKTMEEFIELSSDGNLKLQFTSHLSSKFWLSVQKNTLLLQEKL